MCDQFSSAWDGIYVLGKGHRCSIPLPAFQGRLSASSFHASPPGEHWCCVFGFVPAGTISSSSTWQIFWDASCLWWLLCPTVCARWFLFTPACPGQYTHSSFGGLSSMSDCFHLHCQAGGWDSIGCTVFTGGGCTLLDSEAPPWLFFF